MQTNDSHVLILSCQSNYFPAGVAQSMRKRVAVEWPNASGINLMSTYYILCKMFKTFVHLLFCWSIYHSAGRSAFVLSNCLYVDSWKTSRVLLKILKTVAVASLPIGHCAKCIFPAVRISWKLFTRVAAVLERTTGQMWSFVDLCSVLLELSADAKPRQE